MRRPARSALSIEPIIGSKATETNMNPIQADPNAQQFIGGGGADLNTGADDLPQYLGS